jgi:hypothetical protein
VKPDALFAEPYLVDEVLRSSDAATTDNRLGRTSTEGRARRAGAPGGSAKRGRFSGWRASYSVGKGSETWAFAAPARVLEIARRRRALLVLPSVERYTPGAARDE